MLVKLPSGATTPLEVPSLPSLLAAGGDLVCIASAAFAHEEVEVDELLDSDLLFIVEWALSEFAQSPEGLELAVVADAWRRPPSDVIGINDLPLAWNLERLLYLNLREAASGKPEQDEDSETRVHFSVDEGAA
jgi:hypothetical protein